MKALRPESGPKFIFVTGGVVSSIGKGLTAASLGALLEARGLRVSLMKFDPYINVDPGTMSPFQHGEVYVTEDGAETDLDLGHYERFTSQKLLRENSVSTGQIYDAVISRERKGDYLGGTVQVIPHVTDEIKSRMMRVSRHLVKEMGDDPAKASKESVVIVEIGGTVGDIEGLPFFEAIRQMRTDLGHGCSLLIHVTYLPYIKVAGELKSKPTQHSVKELREIGLQPDFLVCRSEYPVDEGTRKKLSLFCSVRLDHCIAATDAHHIYEVPLNLHRENLDALVVSELNLKKSTLKLDGWKKIDNILKNPKKHVRIAVVGKYVDLKESYKSLNEALVHGGIANQAEPEIQYVDSESLTEKNVGAILGDAHAVLVPGGFGPRGVEGKMLAIQWAREKHIPFFGICYGMQLAAIEFARHVCGVKNATSREWEMGDDKKAQNVIDYMVEQRDLQNKGGTMRLGSYACSLSSGSRAAKIYGTKKIFERHRHRFEFNNQYRELFIKNGMLPVGVNTERDLVEILEIKDHPWFIGVQFHPEFKSKPLKPHPLFAEFVKAAIKSQGDSAKPKTSKGK